MTKKKEKTIGEIEKFYGKLASKNIPELLEYVKDVCPTKIYLASRDYTKIEPYPYSEKK